jgi:hypothetical protein
MIVYDLICTQQHRFEGWFASIADFDRQRGDTTLRCPVCDDPTIERRPSANIQVGRASAPVERPTQEQPTAVAAPQPPEAQMMQLLRHIVSSADNVGKNFPEEARKIHYEEVPPRGIRGQATADEAAELRDEGIEFMSLPAVLASDLN